MQCLRSKVIQAIFSEDGVGKLADQTVAHKALLAALAQDPASQMAHLIAVEHYVGETAPEALIQVCDTPALPHLSVF